MDQTDRNSDTPLDGPRTSHGPEPIRIGYIISGYKRPEWITRLVRRLYAPDHGFFIHYDLRSPAAEYAQLARDLGGMPNVHLLARHKCAWGDFGHVLATLKAIQAMANCNFPYDYAVIATGQDYPIKSDAQIRQALRDAGGRTFLEANPWPIPVWENGRAIDRLRKYHLTWPWPTWLNCMGKFKKGIHFALPFNRAMPEGHKVYFGTGYCYLSRASVKYVHEFLARTPGYADFFRHARIPDESFFQILLMNSPLAKDIVPKTLTHMEWRPPGPGIMTMNDLPVLKESPCLLARKFDPTVDAQVLDELDRLAGAVPGQLETPTPFA